MRFGDRQTSVRRHVGVGCAIIATLVTGIVMGMTFHLDTAEAQASRSFSGGTGLIMNYVKPDATEDFEAVMRKLGDALHQSDNPERVRQAEGWKIYRAQEPGPSNSVLYVWFVDPTVSGADYAVSQILNEAFPAEVQALYEAFSNSFAGGQAMVNLDLVVGF